jgi:hypothetical protein
VSNESDEAGARQCGEQARDSRYGTAGQDGPEGHDAHKGLHPGLLQHLAQRAALAELILRYVTVSNNAIHHLRASVPNPFPRLQRLDAAVRAADAPCLIVCARRRRSSR